MFIMKRTTRNDFIVSAIESIHFSETETWAKTEVSRHERSQDISDLVETRLRHSENVRDLRHCRDTGVKTRAKTNLTLT